MAEQKSNVKGDQLEVYINGELAPLNTSVTINGVHVWTAVRSQRTGSTPIAHLLDGTDAQITINFEEWSREIIARHLGLPTTGDAAYEVPAVGTQAPVHNLRLHDPHAVDGSGDPDFTGDLVFPAVACTGFGRGNDGQGPAEHSVTFVAEKPDGSDSVWEMGYTAP